MRWENTVVAALTALTLLATLGLGAVVVFALAISGALGAALGVTAGVGGLVFLLGGILQRSAGAGFQRLTLGADAFTVEAFKDQRVPYADVQVIGLQSGHGLLGDAGAVTPILVVAGRRVRLTLALGAEAEGCAEALMARCPDAARVGPGDLVHAAEWTPLQRQRVGQLLRAGVARELGITLFCALLGALVLGALLLEAFGGEGARGGHELVNLFRVAAVGLIVWWRWRALRPALRAAEGADSA